MFFFIPPVSCFVISQFPVSDVTSDYALRDSYLLIKKYTFVLRKREMAYCDLVLAFPVKTVWYSGKNLALGPDRGGLKSPLQLSLLPGKSG